MDKAVSTASPAKKVCVCSFAFPQHLTHSCPWAPVETGGRMEMRRSWDTAAVVCQHPDGHTCTPELPVHLSLVMMISTVVSSPHMRRSLDDTYKACGHSVGESHSLARGGPLPYLGMTKPRESRLRRLSLRFLEEMRILWVRMILTLAVVRHVFTSEFNILV